MLNTLKLTARFAAVIAGGVVASGAYAQAAQEPADYVAGLAPYQRPASAPRITAAPVSDAFKQWRLRGVSRPWPGNTATIAQQGNWFSPMFLPGMSRYDLRGLHTANALKAPN